MFVSPSPHTRSLSLSPVLSDYLIPSPSHSLSSHSLSLSLVLPLARCLSSLDLSHTTCASPSVDWIAVKNHPHKGNTPEARVSIDPWPAQPVACSLLHSSSPSHAGDSIHSMAVGRQGERGCSSMARQFAQRRWRGVLTMRRVLCVWSTRGNAQPEQTRKRRDGKA